MYDVTVKRYNREGNIEQILAIFATFNEIGILFVLL